MADEIWKDIFNYEGLYQVSNLGRVKSLSKCKGWYNSKEKILRPRIKNGYYSVVLYKNNVGVEHGVHRLVAQTLYLTLIINLLYIIKIILKLIIKYQI